jgi:hypothetical protein
VTSANYAITVSSRAGNKKPSYELFELRACLKTPEPRIVTTLSFPSDGRNVKCEETVKNYLDTVDVRRRPPSRQLRHWSGEDRYLRYRSHRRPVVLYSTHAAQAASAGSPPTDRRLILNAIRYVLKGDLP